MKTHKHLFERVCALENILAASREALRHGKRGKPPLFPKNGRRRTGGPAHSLVQISPSTAVPSRMFSALAPTFALDTRRPPAHIFAP